MTRRNGSMVLGALAALALAAPAQAQSTPFVYFGGGVSLPMSDYKDYAKTGWLANAGIGVNIGTKGLWLAADVFYGSNKHKAPLDEDKTNLLMGLGTIGYTIGQAEQKVRPYVFGSVGMLNHKYVPGTGTSESESMVAFGGGAGLLFKMGGKSSFFVEGRYLTGSKNGGTTAFVPILAGITIDLK